MCTQDVCPLSCLLATGIWGSTFPPITAIPYCWLRRIVPTMTVPVLIVDRTACPAKPHSHIIRSADIATHFINKQTNEKIITLLQLRSIKSFRPRALKQFTPIFPKRTRVQYCRLSRRSQLRNTIYIYIYWTHNLEYLTNQLIQLITQPKMSFIHVETNTKCGPDVRIPTDPDIGGNGVSSSNTVL